MARNANDDVYAGIDDATDKLERQLSDHKKKLRNRKHNV
ncbi:MAG: HPF/RaiA family ribosome-associated protein [Phycisphaerae bacterium]|nr:HPF/RaiA family ribosome-associated protein [Phycisphaerae bacterium]